MCGIFGYVTNKDEELGQLLIEAAQRLTYRGYDLRRRSDVEQWKDRSTKRCGKSGNSC